MLDAFANFKSTYNLSLCMTYGAISSLFPALLQVANKRFLSLVHPARLAMLLGPYELDCRE